MDPIVIPTRIPRERLVYVERLWLAGVPDHRLQQRVAKRYGVTLRTARRYIARVRHRLAAREAAAPEAVRARAEAMLLESFAVAKKAIKVVTWIDEAGAKRSKEYAAPEVGAMVAAASRLAELYGAVRPARLEITGRNGGPVEVAGLSDEELDRRIAELEAQVRPG